MKYLSTDRYTKFEISDYKHHDYSTITCKLDYVPSHNEDLLIEYNSNFYLFKQVHDVIMASKFSDYIDYNETTGEEGCAYTSFGFFCDEIIKYKNKENLTKEIL